MKDFSSDIKNNQLAKMILEAIGDGVFILNMNARIISWNRAMEKITGYSPGEVMGKSCRILNFNRCFEKECPTGFEECGILKFGKVEPVECFITHKQGHSISVVKNARIIRDAGGRVLGVIEAVTDLTELKNARLKMAEANRRLGELSRLGGIIAKSQVMQNVFTFIKASAASDATIFIQGESGTGKELVAGAIHSIGERKDRPMITVNCSALSETLLESELFGHVKGAFTGASRDRIGRFEEADTGTIFLDEIGEISPYIQVKLLRVLQEKEIERVGDSRKRKINIRIITATNKDLKSLVAQGIFREDLYYRLKVFPIFLPPLRERKEDIPLLVDHFIRLNNKSGVHVKGIEPEAMRTLMNYHWPGNIRELANAVEHAFVLCAGRAITKDDLPIELQDFKRLRRPEQATGFYPAKSGTAVELTRETLVDLLGRCDWNKAEVARRLSLSRASIWKYMKKWGIPLQPGDK